MSKESFKGFLQHLNTCSEDRDKLSEIAINYNAIAFLGKEKGFNFTQEDMIAVAQEVLAKKEELASDEMGVAHRRTVSVSVMPVAASIF